MSKRRKNTIAAPAQTGEFAAETKSLDAAITTFLRQCRVKNLTDDTLAFYKDVLSILKKLVDTDETLSITKADLERAIEKKRLEGVKDVTIEKYYRGWRAFFNYLYTEGFLPENPIARLQLPKSERRIVETFSKAHLRALFAAPNKTTFTGYRDYVLMLTLLDTGVRISEAEGMTIPAINWKERVIKVYGKGRKERFVPFQSTLARHLSEYVKVRGLLEHDYLFVNIDNKPMKKRSMQENIQRYGEIALIKGVRCSPHTFRHTFAKMYVMAGGDMFSLQRILGHTSLDVVRMYVNLFGSDISSQHSKFSPLERLEMGGDDE